MLGLRSLFSGAIRAKTVLSRIQRTPERIQRFNHHDDGPPQPFDNMPFSVNSRYAATIFFSFFFGVGLWAPFLIVWYQMAKRTM